MKRMRRKGLFAAAALSVFLTVTSIFTMPAYAMNGVNELTGYPIADPRIDNQRPIAVMIDNDKAAFPHYGLAEADVVYELMNSTKNNRVTRLMALYKDWNAAPRIGNIRSTRPTNVLLAEEWNAILIHDGGPFYNNAYFAEYNRHLSAGFSRINNGKRREFTEYVTTGEAQRRAVAAGFSTAYDAPVDPTHFNFSVTPVVPAGIAAQTVTLPFPHNIPQLKYNALTQTYDYYEFGRRANDGATGSVPTFKNVILQDCSFAQLDASGYLIYNCIAVNQPGWYITNGKIQPITWSKTAGADTTRFYDANGKELAINPGKTYIALIPSDSWQLIGVQ